MTTSKFNAYSIALLFVCIQFILPTDTVAQIKRDYYVEPKWKPRAILPYEDAIRNDFWPASPKVEVSYADPGFSNDRLSPVPAPGVYPRVLMTPGDVEKIRLKVSLGDQAPLAFKVMWKRVEASRSAFYALVTNNDSLGRVLAKDLVSKAKKLEVKLVELDKHVDRDNLWNVERSIIAEGNPDPPTEIWDLLQYDYLARWMDASEREQLRVVIAKVTHKRISNFLHVPDHFMINNHEEFGMEYIRLMLLIEGLPGFDQQLFNASVHKVRTMLDWFLSKDGMCYESIKGWLNVSAFVAVGLRDRNLLKHDHLRAKMRYFQAALRWENGKWNIRDEMRASAFHAIWMMHYYHPQDKSIDLLYQSTFSTHSFLTNAKDKWPDPVGICQELLLLYADDGILIDGQKIDWTDQKNIDALKLPLVWQDDQRGYVDVRNSWRKDDLHLQFMCKQDFFYGGHEGSENNRLVLWKDGVNWIKDNDMLADKASFLQNMLTVDGKGQRWPPAPGNWLGFAASKDGLVAAGDGHIGYSFTKVMQIHPFSFPSSKTGYLAPFAEGNVDMSRDIQVAFQPSTIKYYDGYGHTDYGPWSGETRLIEGYRDYNPMQQAFRTVQLAKGKYPYVIIADDAKKDDSAHHFSFNLSMPTDAVLVEALTPEIVFQQTDASLLRMGDMLIGRNNLLRDPVTGKYLPQKGDPLCLIRVLWRNTDYGFPVPHLEAMQGHMVVTIPAHAVSPEFRVLVYPFKYGDPMPVTNWITPLKELEVKIGSQLDAFSFAQADAGRTVISMKRDGKTVLRSGVVPARPDAILHGEKFVPSNLRYTRMDGMVPRYQFKDTIALSFHPTAPDVSIVYTLDGTEPGRNSKQLNGRLKIDQSCTVKARTYDPAWVQGDQLSDVVTILFSKTIPVQPLPTVATKMRQGLDLNVYEIDTKMYDDKGFFKADLNMMPDLRKYVASTTTSVSELHLPVITPTSPFLEQRKGFFQFKGEFYAEQTGLYRFDLQSCGPITFDIGRRVVIESTGVFHQQDTHRKGEIVLAKGWHSFELVVCDPLFWNANSLPPAPLHLKVAFNDDPYSEVNHKYFRSVQKGQSITKEGPRWIPSVPLQSEMVAGCMLNIYNQPGKRRMPDYLDVDQQKPFFTGIAEKIESSTQRETVRKYDGYLFIPEDGKYRFQMPYRVGENAWLGSTQASCISQLRIGDQIVLQRGVPGRNLVGEEWLKKGWHKLSIRLGTGSPECVMVTPDNRKISILGRSLKIPVQVVIEPEREVTGKNSFEIYDSSFVKLRFNGSSKAEIRYTLNGDQPLMSSKLYKDSIWISKTSVLTATAFENGKAVAAPASMFFNKVIRPQEGSLGRIDFALPDAAQEATYSLWLGNHVKRVPFNKDSVLNMPKIEASLLYVDINVARGGGPKPGFKLQQIKLRENAITVALWFRTFEQTGKIFGKDGISAFGKSYRTVSCSINNGRITASPGGLGGGKIEPGKWYFLVFSVNEKESHLYLDGVEIAAGLGSKEVSTDALDFFQGHHAEVKAVEVFDRILNARDVKYLYR